MSIDPPPVLTQERKRRSIITPRFGRQEMSDMRRHVFCRESTTDYGLGQDWIGRCDACGDGETCEEFEVRDHCPHEKCSDDPAPLPDDIVVRRQEKGDVETAYGHDGSQEKGQ